MNTAKWIWMMDWCKSRGLPPAQKYAWDAAEKEWDMYHKESIV